MHEQLGQEIDTSSQPKWKSIVTRLGNKVHAVNFFFFFYSPELTMIALYFGMDRDRITQLGHFDRGPNSLFNIIIMIKCLLYLYCFLCGRMWVELSAGAEPMINRLKLSQQMMKN